MRTTYCGLVSEALLGQTITLMGWAHRRRDHGGVIFIDLRDREGLVQIVCDPDRAETFAIAEEVRNEFCLKVTGLVRARPAGTENANLTSGKVEVLCRELEVLNASVTPPFQLDEENLSETTRLTHRVLDLRRPQMQRNMMLRYRMSMEVRRFLDSNGFIDIETPMLTKSTPEGARDYLVPSRVHDGMFFALPQSPQLFKQLLMVAGFDKYFQIAPCFRDEDARADRSPGEFYQLDFEMSFVTQDDVFAAIEPVLHGVFEEFADFDGKGRSVSPLPFRRIPYRESMLRYGSDKPDLRNPLLVHDVGGFFKGSGFGRFAAMVEAGDVVRAIAAPNTHEKSRKFFDDMNAWAQSEGFPGLGYATQKDGVFGGPIANNHGQDGMKAIADAMGLGPNDGIFFAAGKEAQAAKLAGLARTRVGDQLELIDKSRFEFCWIVDFPMFEADEDTGKIDFSHNPFSMPQGELEALETQDPLDILAYQYDIVCNGVELSSGAIRNHRPEIMYKAFEIAGYSRDEVDTNFAGMINAFKYGAPPHGGSAPGVDRIVMLLADEPNIREVIVFPMTQKAEDLMMGAPGNVDLKQLRELHIRLVEPPKAAPAE